MAALTASLFATLGLASNLSVAPATRTVSQTEVRMFVAEASTRCGVPITWIERVIAAESGGRATLDGVPITSPAGAMGLMQLMPGTWRDLRRELGLGENPYDARDNIVAGACYLRWLHAMFGYPGLFAAYNAGPGRYADYLGGRRGLPLETRAYLAEITGRSSSASVAPVAPTPLFVPLSHAREGAARPSSDASRRPQSTALFAIVPRL